MSSSRSSGNGRRRPRVLRRLGHVEQAGLGGQRAVAADAVDGAVARGGHQPGAAGWPGAPSRGQRSAAIAKASCAASSARSKSPRKPIRAASTRPHCVAEDLLEDRYHSTIGRTSIAPPMRAAGIRAASSIAASRSSASKKR